MTRVTIRFRDGFETRIMVSRLHFEGGVSLPPAPTYSYVVVEGCAYAPPIGGYLEMRWEETENAG